MPVLMTASPKETRFTEIKSAAVSTGGDWSEVSADYRIIVGFHGDRAGIKPQIWNGVGWIDLYSQEGTLIQTAALDQIVVLHLPTGKTGNSKKVRFYKAGGFAVEYYYYELESV